VDFKLSRRGFLKETALLGTAGITSLAATAHTGSASALEGEKRTTMLPIVDTHQHLWDLKKFRLPWIKQGSPLARSYLMEDYLKATQGLNVVKAVYMEVDVAPDQQVDEAEYILDICKQGKSPTVAAVISGRPAADGFRNYMARFKDSAQIKGVRQVLHNEDVPAGYCLDPKFIKGIQLLGEMGKSYDLCLRPGELLDGAKLIDACPDTRFILDHCGNGNVQARDRTAWARGMEAIAKRKNVVCKVSGIVVSAQPGRWTADDLAPIVNHTLDVFGPDRVMFGGDWPVCTLTATYKQWVDALNSVVGSRSAQAQRKLFHDNVLSFYGLG
jgi:predicted TIM-barrel fold metal-dependent hydrolase